MSKVLLLHIPVLHNGYFKLLEKYNGEIKTLYVIDKELSEDLSEFKEIRAVDPKQIVKMLKNLGYSFKVKLLGKSEVSALKNSEVIVADEEILKKLLRKYLKGIKSLTENVFLRWDEGSVASPNVPHYNEETDSDFDRKMMRKAEKKGGQSTDWWRRVGCVVVKNKKVVITSFNQHFPRNDTQYVEGDPRDFIKAGQLGFLGSSAHAEQLAIAKAAKKGISLRGADMYVSTYPCPACAKLMAVSGIKTCFFRGGNAYLDVEAVFKSTGLKAVMVK